MKLRKEAGFNSNKPKTQGNKHQFSLEKNIQEKIVDNPTG